MNYLKSGAKVFGNYLISLVFFIVFLYPFIVITGERFSNWLPIYSILIFIPMFSMLFSNLNSLAKKEKRSENPLKVYPLKGLIIGLIGFSPVILLEIIYPLIVLNNPTANRLKELALKTILGPVFFILRFTGTNAVSYAIASLVVPAIAMLGYITGFYDIRLNEVFRKKIAKDK
ncbi:MAG: hypothetical protein ACOX7R_07090 [Acetivibrionales bacterium]